MHRFLSLFAVLLLLFFPLLSLAHGGNTDSIGGHYDNSTGKYHFHHGYSAHQHINGLCPYDKSGRTDWPTAKPDRATQTPRSSSYASGAYSLATRPPTTSPAQEKQGAKPDIFHGVVTVVMGASFIGMIVAGVRSFKS